MFTLTGHGQLKDLEDREGREVCMSSTRSNTMLTMEPT